MGTWPPARVERLRDVTGFSPGMPARSWVRIC